jgi:NodT family efflux transporter outer membrane factor (OMF) lipoprotein
MRTPEILTLVCVLATVAGCATAPAEPPALPAAAVPLTWQQPLPHNGELSDLSRWWQDLGDPLLVDLIDAAQQASPSLAGARSRVLQSRAALRQAQARLGPTLDGTASASRGVSQPATPAATTVQAGVQASWEMDLFGANRLASDAAKARLDGAQASWHDARVLVAAEVATRYFSQRACEQQARLARADAQSRQETARLSELSLKAGFTAGASAALARASAADAQGRSTQQAALCSLDVKALVALTGLDEPALLQRLAGAPEDLAANARLTVSSLPAQTLAQRPDVFAAQRDVVAASADTGMAQAQGRPQLRLSGSIGALHYRASGANDDLATWSLGPLAISIPLYDGGQRAAAVSAAQARYDEAIALYQGRVRQAVRETEDALVALQSTAARATDAQTAETGYRDWFVATETRYQGGLASLVELEDARRTRIASANTTVSLRLERIQAWIALYRAAGGGWSAQAPGNPAP